MKATEKTLSITTASGRIAVTKQEDLEKINFLADHYCLEPKELFKFLVRKEHKQLTKNG
jgi:hypothetical protein